MAASAASAKTLVYCSEGSPEGFIPALHLRHHLRCLVEPDLQPPGRVRARHAPRSCPASPRAGRSRTTASPTPSSCAGREVADHQELHADARLQCRRRGLHFERQWTQDHPYHKVSAARTIVLRRHGHAQAAQVGREGRRLHGQVHAERSRRRRSSPTWRWTSPRSCRPSMPTRC